MTRVLVVYGVTVVVEVVVAIVVVVINTCNQLVSCFLELGQKTKARIQQHSLNTVTSALEEGPPSREQSLQQESVVSMTPPEREMRAFLRGMSGAASPDSRHASRLCRSCRCCILISMAEHPCSNLRVLHRFTGRRWHREPLFCCRLAGEKVAAATNTKFFFELLSEFNACKIDGGNISNMTGFFKHSKFHARNEFEIDQKIKK